MNKLATMLALALVSAALFACGGSDDSTTAATTETNVPLGDNVAGDSRVRYVADPSGEIKYRITEASASAGKATIELVNPQSVAHDLALEAPNGETIGKTERVSEGVTSTKVVLKPGEYVAYCSVPGHRKAGMKGHLTVWPPS